MTGSAPSATWPTTTSSWSCSGPPGHPGRPAGRGGAVPAPAAPGADRLGHLRALPRRHRLGGVRRGRGAVGLDGFAHRRFLSRLLRRPFPGSFARGALFQENLATGDARISGSAASLCGVESALEAGDPGELTVAMRRLESLYAVVFSFGGIPLIYMGDELALRNDPGWAGDPAHAHDNRWMHRPRMDWSPAARRQDPESVEGRAFAALRGLVTARRSLLALRSGGSDRDPRPPATAACWATGGPTRAAARSWPLTNFSDVAQQVDAGVIARAGLRSTPARAARPPGS